ncbi:MAG: lipid A deacylase LpxR family protein [Verrucomicrobiota bacterium]
MLHPQMERRLTHLYALLACFSGLGLDLYSQAPASSLIIQWDNDLLTGTDRDYTNGARIAYISELSRESAAHNFLQNPLARISEIGPQTLFASEPEPTQSDYQFYWGTGLTQLIFTPENTTATTAPPGERPYAGWLGLEFTLQSNRGSSMNSVTLSIGTTGPYSFAEETQEWVHENISDSPIFQGWDSQVPAEATLNLHFDRKQSIRILERLPKGDFGFDGHYEWGGSLGNFRTDAYLGTLLRWGYNVSSTYSMPRVQVGSSSQAFHKAPSEQTISISIFGGLRGYAVLHDITLDGPIFRDFDTGVDSEPFVGEVIYGLNLSWKWIEVSFAQTLRSDEFTGQREHLEFGSIMARIGGRF